MPDATWSGQPLARSAGWAYREGSSWESDEPEISSGTAQRAAVRTLRRRTEAGFRPDQLRALGPHLLPRLPEHHQDGDLQGRQARVERRPPRRAARAVRARRGTLRGARAPRK